MHGLLYFKSGLICSVVAHGLAAGAVLGGAVIPARLIGGAGAFSFQVSLVPGDGTLSGGGINAGEGVLKDFRFPAGQSEAALKSNLMDCSLCAEKEPLADRLNQARFTSASNIQRKSTEAAHSKVSLSQAKGEKPKKTDETSSSKPRVEEPEAGAGSQTSTQECETTHLGSMAGQCGPGLGGLAAGGAGKGSGLGGGRGGPGGPALLFGPKPSYPSLARKAGFEGRVVLGVRIGKDGRVREASVLKSSGRSDCDESARRTVLQGWLFEPASVGGRPVEWSERIAVTYRLQ